MKKLACLLLCAALLLSMTACGQSEKSPEIVEAPAYSVPEDLEPAFEAGIAEESMRKAVAENAVCTQKDAAVLLYNAYKLTFPEGNRFYEDMLLNASSEKPATRYWIAQGMYMANVMHWLDRGLYFTSLDAEHPPFESEYTYTDYHDFIRHFSYLTDELPSDVFVQTAYTLQDAVFKSVNPETGRVKIYDTYWDVGTDTDSIFYHENQEKYRQLEDYGTAWVVEFALRVTDRETGKYAMKLDDQGRFLPQKELTFRDAIEIALVYSNSYEKDAQQVSVTEARGYDKAIITQALLDRESSLPDCSCQHLPPEWRGMHYAKLAYVSTGCLGQYDNRNVLEEEIRQIAETGFNYLGIVLSPSYYQGPYFESGYFNETRLKDLDQLIAWCLKYDLHAELRFSDVGGLNAHDFNQPDTWDYRDQAMRTQNAEVRQTFADTWGFFARRYQGISNRDLSFNLLVEPSPSTDENYITFLRPAVEAIRASTPDRCIIIDLHDPGLQGKGYETLGAALSCHQYEPRAFCVYNMSVQESPSPSQIWPYPDPSGKLIDAKLALNERGMMHLSCSDIQAIAKKNDLGFMVGEFGIFGEGIPGCDHGFYPYETVNAFLTDTISVFTAEGIPWCYGGSQGPEGLYLPEPGIQECEFRSLGEAPYYVNVTMENMFKELLNP